MLVPHLCYLQFIFTQGTMTPTWKLYVIIEASRRHLIGPQVKGHIPLIFLFNGTYLLALQDTNPPCAVWRICFITGLSVVCRHTVSICGASVGGAKPWTTAWPVPCFGHRAAEREHAERQRGGESQPTLGVPKVQMPSKNITQTILNVDCIFTSSSNSDQRLIWL